MVSLVKSTSAFFKNNPSDIASVGNSLVWISEVARGALSPEMASLKNQFSVAKNFISLTQLGDKTGDARNTLLRGDFSHRGLATVAGWVSTVADSLDFLKCVGGRLKGAAAVAEKVNFVAILVSSSWSVKTAYGEWKKQTTWMNNHALNLVGHASYLVFSVVALGCLAKQRSLDAKMPAWVACALVSSGRIFKAMGKVMGKVACSSGKSCLLN
jgi:hypothetical protein